MSPVLVTRDYIFVPADSRKKKSNPYTLGHRPIFISIINKCVHCTEDSSNSLPSAATAWFSFTSAQSPLVDEVGVYQPLAAHYRADPR